MLEVLSRVISSIVKPYATDDKLIQVSLNTVQALDYPVSTPYIKGSSFSVTNLLDMVERVIGSQTDFGVTDDMRITVNYCLVGKL